MTSPAPLLTAPKHLEGTVSGPAPGRLSELDGLRGLAALLVFVAHVAGAFATLGTFGLQPFFFWLTWLGPAAVALFFVLSGFVLAFPFGGAHPRPFSYPDFFVRRFFRIYPAFWAALLLAIALRAWLFQPLSAGDMGAWLGTFWQSPATWAELWNHVSIIRIEDTDMFNTVVWTLEVEVQMSLLLSLYVAALCLRRSRLLVGAAILGSLVAAFTGYQLIVSFHGSFLVGMGFGFAPLFVLGASVAFYCEDLLRWVRTWPRALHVATMGVGAVLWCAPGWLTPDRVPNVLVPTTLVGMGTLVLITAALEWRPLGWLLRRGPVQSLGRLSYGLYLTHFPFLLVCLSWDDRLFHNPLLACAAALTLSLGAACLLHRFVEQPAQALGRALLARARSRWKAVAAPERAQGYASRPRPAS